MNSKKRNISIYWWGSIIGLIIVLAIAQGADILLSYIREQNASSFALTDVLFGSHALIALLLAAALLLLSWFVLIRSPRNIWLALLYLLVGFAILLYPFLCFGNTLCGWLPLNFRQGLYDFVLARSMLTFSVGGFVAIIGLFNLVWLRRKQSD